MFRNLNQQNLNASIKIKKIMFIEIGSDLT